MNVNIEITRCVWFLMQGFIIKRELLNGRWVDTKLHQEGEMFSSLRVNYFSLISGTRRCCDPWFKYGLSDGRGRLVFRVLLYMFNKC